MSEKERKEIEKIRSGYEAKEPSKLERLKALNKEVELPATVFAYVFGSVGALVLGTGMCLAMKVIGGGRSFAMPLGIVVGVVGIAMVAANYFLYKGIRAKRRKKYASRILALADEIPDGKKING